MVCVLTLITEFKTRTFKKTFKTRISAPSTYRYNTIVLVIRTAIQRMHKLVLDNRSDYVRIRKIVPRTCKQKHKCCTTQSRSLNWFCENIQHPDKNADSAVTAWVALLL